jgi:hypothetical protein
MSPAIFPQSFLRRGKGAAPVSSHSESLRCPGTPDGACERSEGADRALAPNETKGSHYMRFKSRGVLLALVAVFAMSAVAVASASAALPEFKPER